MSDPIEDIFDTDLLEKGIKKAKKKTQKRIIIISIMVFVLGSVLNMIISIMMANGYYKFNDIEVKTTIPNAYISEVRDTMGFLGGKSDYVITKAIGNKPVIVENESSYFGIIPNLYISRGQNRIAHKGGEWSEYYWENGFKKMMFFHPELNYKLYKNDFEILKGLPAHQIVEMGVSFDKAYSIEELSSLLRGFNISWVWIDAYSDAQMKEWEQAIEEYDPTSNYIIEGETFGTYIYDSDRPIEDIFVNEYMRNLKELEKGNKSLYNQIKAKGLEDLKNVKIIGTVVYGSPKELIQLEQIKEVRAATIGCVVNKY